VREGYGPIVSLGVTAQALFVFVDVVCPVDVSSAEGAVGDSPHAAATAAAADPMAPKAARRLSLLLALLRTSIIVPSVMRNTLPHGCWETLSVR
jgi:hypothetical protein